MGVLRANVSRVNYPVRDKITAAKVSKFVEEEKKLGFLLPTPKDRVVDITGW